jgi:ribonuclease P protein component
VIFGRERRIRRHGEFVHAQRTGARVVLRNFVVLLSRRADALPARLGLVVTRKVGNAVVRNRIKRLCREAFRRTMLFPAGADVVVIARDSVVGLRDVDVIAEWKQAQPRFERTLATIPLPTAP